MRARSKLGQLGEHASSATDLEREADATKAKLNWWRVCRLTVRRYEERRKRCGEWTYEGTCTHCGLVHAWPRACGATMVCADCALRKSKRLYRKLMPAIRLQLARGMAKWHAAGRPKGGMPLLTLMTLTVRSVDLADLAERRKLLSDAWNRFRSWYQGKYHRRLSYAWTAECTDGARNQGNVHLHAVVLLPMVDYKVLDAAWVRAVGGIGGHIDFQRSRSNPKAAARYVAKYASKGVKFASVQTAAAWVQAQHAKRGVSSSRDFWLTDEEKHGPWVLRLVRPRDAMEDASESDQSGGVTHGRQRDTRHQRAGPSP